MLWINNSVFREYRIDVTYFILFYNILNVYIIIITFKNNFLHLKIIVIELMKI